MPETQGDLNKTLDQLLRLVVRRRWWLLLTACASVLATSAILSLIPNHYTSEATLLVVQQQVPQRYVTPTTTTDVSAALQAMTQEVLSRPTLLNIVQDFGLYAKERKRRAPEEIIELIRSHIDIQPIEAKPDRKDINAFRISFIADDPKLAQAVTGKLTSLFIEENLRMREDQATNTTNFLQEHLDTAKTKLTEQEERLRDFRMQHLGELPEQQQGNLEILAGLQTQLQNTMASLSRAQEQRVYLESLLTGYRNVVARGISLPGPSGVARTASPIEVAEGELARLRSERTTLLAIYTPEHPDVVKADREITKAETLLERLRASKASATQVAGLQGMQPEKSEEEASITQVKGQLEANRLEMANLSKDVKQLEAGIVEYRRRLNSTPIREQEVAGILRDYDMSKQNYADLLNKEIQSQLATSLEKQQGGERFRLADPPSLPTLPSSPKRLKISLAGAVVGILLGIGLALLVDVRDRSFHAEKDVSEFFPLHLVVGMPSVLTPAEERARKWKSSFEWLGGSLLALAVVVTEFLVCWHS